MKMPPLRLFLLGILLSHCSSDVQRNGKNRHIITCEKTPQNCHDKAKSTCKDGYLVTNRVRPQRTEDGVQYKLNIRCREAKIFY